MDQTIAGAAKVALISGGTRGLGRAMAAHFVAAGWQVAVCARRQPEGDGSGHFIQGDLRDPADAERVVAETVNVFGRIDLVVNNAGGTPVAELAASSSALVEKIVALNLLAPLYLSRAAYPALRAAGGSIVNIASISGRRPAPGTIAYGAAKAGLISATEGMAMEWAPHVRCNAVVVGLVESEDQSEHYGEGETAGNLAAIVPMGRLARGQDLAECVAWLASDPASYVTGATIELHGGGEVPAFLALASRKN
jgi:NAD(P)-dependent dehydrogenase (short-subunit alcohol dehydrogenase family)